MKILVINAGSSSVKFTLFHMDQDSILLNGIVERIGLSDTRLRCRYSNGKEVNKIVDVSDTTQAIQLIDGLLTDRRLGILQDGLAIDAIGHRVVHGGEKISDSHLIDDGLKAVIKDCFTLAPLHNPPNLEGIEGCELCFPGVPQVAVFDTAFHSTIPDYAYMYAIPYAFYEKQGIRRYGFHGISHKYVSKEAARLLNKPLEQLKLITCHLGNGCSITAVRGGKSIDTSMGFTPLEGLIMGTRCGDLDPAVVCYLMKQNQLDCETVDKILNKDSGLLGLSGTGSSDLRDIISAMKNGNPQALLAFRSFCYRIKKYIGSYITALGGLDALVFTAGIGENSDLTRSMVCEGLENLNGLRLIIDAAKNRACSGQPCRIQSPESSVEILVIPTHEEKEIASETLRILTKRNLY